MSNAKRVLYIAPQPFFIDRGSPLRVRSTVSALGELGYEVDLLALPFGSDLDLPGVRILRSYGIPGVGDVPIGPSWRKIVFDALLLVKAFQLLIRNRYDIVHGVEEGGIIAALFNKFRRTPYIFDMHSHMSEQLAHSGFFRGTALKWFTALERFCMRNASGIVTVGDDNAEKARAIAIGTPACPLSDLPLDSQSNYSKSRVQELRNEFQLQGKKVVVYTGNFEPYQGIDLLLDGYAAFLSSVADRSVHRLLLVGGGTGSEALVKHYQGRVAALGLEQSVVFAGQRSSLDMGAFYALSDVLVSPRTEGTNTPLKIYCYMQAQRAIVATRILSHTQVLTEANSFLADPNATSMAEAFRRVFLDGVQGDHDRANRIAAALELQEREYSKDAFRRRIGALYAEILGMPPQGESSGDVQRAALSGR